MSLPGATIEQLRHESDSLRREAFDDVQVQLKSMIAECRSLADQIEKLKDEKQSLELANETLKRRVASLEKDRT